LLGLQALSQEVSETITTDSASAVVVLNDLEHSPKKATIRSAIIPGWGQVYNKKYWKVPVIYAAFGTCTYFAIENRRQYIRYRDAYRAETDGDSTTISEFANLPITTEGIRDWRDQYKQWMELSIILGGITYVLNIVDASVDAHLFAFDVSDDLSLRWQPHIRRDWRTQSTFTGVSLKLTFSK